MAILLRLLLWLINTFENKVVGVGMGDKGKLTRILNLYFGSPWTYVAVGVRSAPGQLYIDEYLTELMYLDIP